MLAKSSLCKRNVNSVFLEKSLIREEFLDSLFLNLTYFRSQRPRSFWLALGIATSGKVQFPEHAQRIRFVFSANKIVRFDCKHAHSDGKFVDRGLLVLELPRGRDSWRSLKGARPLGTRVNLTVSTAHACPRFLATR